MKYFFSKMKARFRRIASVVLVFGVSAVVLAYFLGFYELSFLDRAALLGSGSSAGAPSGVVTPETKPSDGETAGESGLSGESTPDTETGDTETDASAGEEDTPPGSPPAEIGKITSSVVSVIHADRLSSVPHTASSVAALQKKGYSLSLSDWSSDSRLGLMQFSFRLTDKYSISTRTVQKTEYVYPEINGEIYPISVDVTEERPAVELYMGYILYNQGGKLYLLESDGTALFSFDDTITSPAYTRMADGTPLFQRLIWNAETQTLDKEYYRVSDSRTGFAAVEYDEAMDGRGLYFDYPASYGITDNAYIVRAKEEESAVKERTEAEAERIAALTPEELEAEEEQRKTEKIFHAAAYPESFFAYIKYGSDLTGYRFLRAFDFQNGFAAATGYDYRNALVFINEYGYTPLSGNRLYYHTGFERYVITSWRLPISFGIESIGSFYFDHGLVRVRRQTIDQWIYHAYDNINVNLEEDILIDTKGKEFPLPKGYTLKGYSCGMILLEKDGRYGFMDYTGNWIAEPIYTAATPFINGLGTLTTADGRVGMIDTAGNIVLPFAYKSISQASSGLIAAYREGERWEVYQIMTKN